jgi:uncharacterized protein YacL
MQLSLTFIRTLFLSLSILLATTLAVAGSPPEETWLRALGGATCGAAFGLLVMSLDILFKRFNLRTFNTAILGLFFGYLMGTAILSILKASLNFASVQIDPPTFLAIQAAIFLIACYLGLVMTTRASHELHLSIPFIHLKTSDQTKKDILLDPSALSDPRIIDLATSGILDQCLVIPRFLLKEIQELSESHDETSRIKARRKLETIKKLEAIPSLELRYAENDFKEIQDLHTKFIRLAHQLNAHILTADNLKSQTHPDGVRFINLHALSNALKPLALNGESLNIKIQRFGKEPRQGVGYLDDGTMVVVNGGADYIGATIRAQVLSVKHTSSGRMIFCNTADADMYDDNMFASSLPSQTSALSNHVTV